jgi:hypothetical protein
MEILESERWNYQLTKYGEMYTLHVLCGTAGLFEVCVILNPDQIENYRKVGKQYTTKLAQEIRDNPSLYR